MTTLDHRPSRTPVVIDGELATPAPASNPHTIGLRITAFGALATTIGSVHGVETAPEHLHLAVGADSAAIGLFLLNLWLHWRHQASKR